MGYEVINEGTETLIKGAELVVCVHTGPANDGLTYGLGHLYMVKGGFVPVRTYVFEVTDLADVTVEAVKKIMDFFFSVLLDTEWYVKEIPPGSRLFPQEARRLYGEVIMEDQYGAIDIIRSGWSKYKAAGTFAGLPAGPFLHSRKRRIFKKIHSRSTVETNGVEDKR